MDQPKIERLLRLIMLMTSKVDYTIENISARLEITPRSVYRYIDTLRDCGFVIEKKRSNLYKLVKIPNSSVNFNKLIYFSEEEACIINSLISSLDNTNSLKATLQKKLYAIYDLTTLADFVTDKESAACVEALGKAIRSKRKVILKDYESAHSQTVSDRHVEPFAFSANYIDVWAYAPEKQENRVYKVARIAEVIVLPNAWEHEARHHKAETDCFRMNGKEEIHVKLELSLRAKNLLIEEYPLSEKDIRSVGGKWILETAVRSLEGVGRFVIGLAGDIKLLDSPALESYVRDYVKNNLGSYITESET